MAVSVRDFNRKHPSTDASHTSVLNRLDGTISRIEEVGREQIGGFLSRHSSTVRRKELRRRLREGLLLHLVTVARDAATSKPALTEQFKLPEGNANSRAFQTAGRKLLEQGKAEQELLLKHGLGGSLLDDLSAALDEFDASVVETNAARQGHVVASAELEALSDEIMLLVGMLDGINQYRFEKQPELLAGWESAKRIPSGPQPVRVENPVNPATGPVQAGPGEVQPAA
jgi:hypothetical protein